MKSRARARPGYDKLVLERGVSAGDDWVRVAPESIRDVLRGLQSEGYEVLLFLTCVDHLATPPPTGAGPAGEAPGRFELVYQLRDMDRKRLLRVRTFVGGDDPEIESVHDLYPPANWDERETWDLFGIRFQGHPGLTRILMPDDWVGHPLRRDYPVGGEPVDFSAEHERWQTTPPRA